MAARPDDQPLHTDGKHMNAEQNRLEDDHKGKVLWKKWGPYLSERQWGTVREDYSPNGDAWNYFTHDQARSIGPRRRSKIASTTTFRPAPDALRPYGQRRERMG